MFNFKNKIKNLEYPVGMENKDSMKETKQTEP